MQCMLGNVGFVEEALRTEEDPVKLDEMLSGKDILDRKDFLIHVSSA